MASTAESDGPEMLDFEDFKERYQKVPVEEYPNNVLEAVPEPLVSVHVSTYQHADFIRDCLDGVLMQETDFPMEIIIGEDESDDGTREICKEYADEYPEKIRLFLHRRENNISIQGDPTGRFQFVYSHFVSRGKYIFMCEGDDYWTDKRKVKKQVQLLENRIDCVFSFHNSIPEGKLENQKGENKIEKNKCFSKEYVRKMPVSGSTPHIASMCFERENMIYPKKFLEVFNADDMLVSMLGFRGKGVYQTEISPSVRRIHDKGIWSSLNKSEEKIKMAKTYEIMSEYFSKRGKEDAKKIYKKAHIDSIESEIYVLLSKGKYMKSARKSLRMYSEIIGSGNTLQFFKSSYNILRFIMGMANKKINKI